MKGTSVTLGSHTGCIQLPEGLPELFPPLRLPWQVPRPGWEGTEELPAGTPSPGETHSPVVPRANTHPAERGSGLPKEEHSNTLNRTRKEIA